MKTQIKIRDKSIPEKFTDVCIIILDVLKCIDFAIPLLLQATYKLFHFNRKDISGKLALVSWKFCCKKLELDF